MNRQSSSAARRRTVTRCLSVFLLLVLSLALCACQGVQVKPKGEIVTGVSVGGRR